jgi:hypothetical protein
VRKERIRSTCAAKTAATGWPARPLPPAREQTGGVVPCKSNVGGQPRSGVGSPSQREVQLFGPHASRYSSHFLIARPRAPKSGQFVRREARPQNQKRLTKLPPAAQTYRAVVNSYQRKLCEVAHASHLQLAQRCTVCCSLSAREAGGHVIKLTRDAPLIRLAILIGVHRWRDRWPRSTIS